MKGGGGRGGPNSTNRRLTQESLSVAVPEQRTLVCPLNTPPNDRSGREAGGGGARE